MAERTTVTQVVQIGVESTSGTAVAADKKLQSLGIDPAPQHNKQVFRPTGHKYPTVAALGKEWITASIDGAPTYSELIYPLSSILTEATPTQPDSSAAPNTYEWLFEPSTTDPDTVKTFTVEQGSSERAHRFAHGLVTGLTITYTRDEITLSGDMLGQKLEDDVSLTADPDDVDLIPVVSDEVNVYVDDSAANLGNTKFTRVLRAEFQLNNRFNPLWVLDRAEDSFATIVETVPAGQVTLLLEADAQGMGLLTDLRNEDKVFIRIEGEGDVIEDTQNYEFRLDTAVELTELGSGGFEDEEGVFAVQAQGTIFHDATWDKALSVLLRNQQSSL